ncbi:MAG: M20/M25/M40 family metallo-hydrolase [Ignavibacteriales bacterium]|nr:M20/M25/M40 family metallo-hydrolase [Ignavibacteriales bacterium]
MRCLRSIFLLTLLALFPLCAQNRSDDLSKLIGEIWSGGQHASYLQKLSDEIGHRLTGSPGGERSEQAVLQWMKELKLENVHLEPFRMPARWERGTASAVVVKPYARKLTVASYTWTPGTRSGGVMGPVVDAGTGKPEEIEAIKSKLKGAIALVAPAGVTLDEVIGNFYRTPEFVKECAAAGAVAVMIASDKEKTLLYTSPVSFNGEVSPMPAVSIAREDVEFLRRLISARTPVEVKVDLTNKLGPAFMANNVVGEIRGTENPEEEIMLGAHLDSNDLGPGALDNAAGCAALLETARAIKQLGLKPKRTIRFVFFMGEEEGMIGSTEYVKAHLQEMANIVAVLIMDIGAGKPLGWFSMGRTDLDGEIQSLMAPLAHMGVSLIVHDTFAATDNAAFMAAGVPNLVMLQDDAPYFPVHHTAADTPDKAEIRDFTSCVVALAATTHQLADQPKRFGKRLNAMEIGKMMKDSNIEYQWRVAKIWPLK